MLGNIPVIPVYRGMKSIPVPLLKYRNTVIAVNYIFLKLIGGNLVFLRKKLIVFGLVSGYLH